MNNSFCYGVDGVVFAHTNIFTAMEFAATLSDDDVAWNDELTAVNFHTQTLGVAVASVSR